MKNIKENNELKSVSVYLIIEFIKNEVESFPNDNVDDIGVYTDDDGNDDNNDDDQQKTKTDYWLYIKRMWLSNGIFSNVKYGSQGNCKTPVK